MSVVMDLLYQRHRARRKWEREMVACPGCAHWPLLPDWLRACPRCQRVLCVVCYRFQESVSGPVLPCCHACLSSTGAPTNAE